jgi:hypothetical protein
MMKGENIKKFFFAFFLPLLLIIFLSEPAFAKPTEPPPTGKIWVKVDGAWILVVSPPGDGPYIWKEGAWVLDTTPPPASSQWVPGHWVSGHWKGNRWIPGHWVEGHWKVVKPAHKGATWVPGHWKGNKWIPGHWKGSYPPKKKWVPGHRAPGGKWIPGHWK